MPSDFLWPDADFECGKFMTNIESDKTRNDFQCRQCLKWLPGEMFQAHSHYTNGHRSVCKKCISANRKIARDSKPKSPIIVRSSEEKKERNRLYKIKWTETHGRERLAQYRLRNAIKFKKISRPNKCSLCSRECIPFGHHSNYDKPLNVTWVCRYCHMQIHSKLTSAQVESIRNAYATQGVSQGRLARMHGITWTCVHNILHQNRWKNYAAQRVPTASGAHAWESYAVDSGEGHLTVQAAPVSGRTT
jgi:hypothetical protein